MTPIIDLHCDLLSYLTRKGSDPNNSNDIGCSLPLLREGNVKLQVLAIYTAVGDDSVHLAQKQAEEFEKLCETNQTLKNITDAASLDKITSEENDYTGVVVSIENAAGLCLEDDDIKETIKNLDKIISKTEKIFYIGLTHHTENRFGGGNNSDAGLKEDGKRLLDHISDRKIAIDYSHTSDKLAEGILNYIEKQRLNIRILASHSNFRSVFFHKRNLTDEFAKEIMHRNGLIGINFLRAFLNDKDEDAIFSHIEYGLKLGARKNLAFGADFFYTNDMPEKEKRIPFYYELQRDASVYPKILELINEKMNNEKMTEEDTNNFAYKNAVRFIKELWL
ncbi:dipeptidase [soil metagenome]